MANVTISCPIMIRDEDDEYDIECDAEMVVDVTVWPYDKETGITDADYDGIVSSACSHRDENITAAQQQLVADRAYEEYEERRYDRDI